MELTESKPEMKARTVTLYQLHFPPFLKYTLARRLI